MHHAAVVRESLVEPYSLFRQIQKPPVLLGTEGVTLALFAWADTLKCWAFFRRPSTIGIRRM